MNCPLVIAYEPLPPVRRSMCEKCKLKPVGPTTALFERDRSSHPHTSATGASSMRVLVTRPAFSST